MKIAYATTYDLENPDSWPRRHLGLYGAGAKIIQTLREEDIDITAVGPLGRKRSLISKLKWQFYKNVRGENFYGGTDPWVARSRARQIQRQLPLTNADILLCPENAIPLANVESDRPIVLWTDTTLGSLINFYPYLSNLCNEARNSILHLEQKVLDRCSLVILNSQWASDQTQQLYGVPGEKIKVIPRGASQAHSLSDEAFERVLQQRKERRPYQMLFLGVDWQRKGGDIAFEIVKTLNRQGIEAELHIVGCKPPFEPPDFVQVHGFVNKSTAVGQAKLAELFRKTHFLLYPTRADAMGVVLSEAASFGVPSLASDVGGIASVVKANVTGKTFSIESGPEAYCQFIAEYIENDRYATLARSTFAYYKNYVSWAAVGKQAKAAFNELLVK